VLIVLLVGAHVGAALFHYFIRKDGVLARMLPQAGRRG
jgi:cytochrome b561